MKTMDLFSKIIVMGVITVLFASCAGMPQSKKGEPDWVTLGSGAFKDGGKQTFYGVGAISGVRNKPLARTAAQNRARAEITKTFETYSASLMKDYAASTTGGGVVKSDTATSEEQHIEQAVKTFSAATLSGVIIADYWTDSSDGTLYALAKLDLENFKDSLDKISQLNAEVRDYIRKTAEKSFDILAKEVENRAK